jgi:hypothetical protein
MDKWNAATIIGWFILIVGILFFTTDLKNAFPDQPIVGFILLGAGPFLILLGAIQALHDTVKEIVTHLREK